jgi:hypothetical protein
LCQYYKQDLLGRGVLELIRAHGDRFNKGSPVNLSMLCDYVDENDHRHHVGLYFPWAVRVNCPCCRRPHDENLPRDSFTRVEIDPGVYYQRCGECTTKGRLLCHWSFLPIDECVLTKRLVNCCKLETGGEPVPLIL